MNKEQAQAQEQADAWRLLFKLIIIATLIVAASAHESIVDLILTGLGL